MCSCFLFDVSVFFLTFHFLLIFCEKKLPFLFFFRGWELALPSRGWPGPDPKGKDGEGQAQPKRREGECARPEREEEGQAFPTRRRGRLKFYCIFLYFFQNWSFVAPEAFELLNFEFEI